MKKVLKIIGIVCIVILVLLAIIGLMPEDTKTYELNSVGNYKKNNDIIVNNIEVTQTNDSASIKCTVNNNNLHRIKYVAVYFRAYDKNGNFLGSTEDQILAEEMSFNEDRSFDVEIDKVLDGDINQVKLARMEYRYYIDYPKNRKTKRIIKDFVKEKDMKLIE